MHRLIESLLGDVEVPDFDPVVPGGTHDLGLVAVNAVDGVLVRGVALNALLPDTVTHAHLHIHVQGCHAQVGCTYTTYR